MVTLASGVALSTPAKDLKEMRHNLQHHAPRHRSNPLYRLLLRADAPWALSYSSVAGWYEQVGLADQLVGRNISHYAQIAAKMASDRFFLSTPQPLFITLL